MTIHDKARYIKYRYIIKIFVKNLLKYDKKCYNMNRPSAYSIRNGGIDMADIYEFVKKSNNSRPLYTSYELSKKVKDKRISEGIDASGFASKYDIPLDILLKIEEGTCSFSPKIYKACGQILGLATDELLSEINDDVAAANFRSDGNDANVQGTFELANMLFNEIIIQRKIGIN